MFETFNSLITYMTLFVTQRDRNGKFDPILNKAYTVIPDADRERKCSLLKTTIDECKVSGTYLKGMDLQIESSFLFII